MILCGLTRTRIDLCRTLHGCLKTSNRNTIKETFVEVAFYLHVNSNVSRKVLMSHSSFSSPVLESHADWGGTFPGLGKVHP